MKRTLLFITAGLLFLLNSCKEKPLLENLDLQKCSYTPTKLSFFLGNHRIIILEKDSTLPIPAFPTIIKKAGHFYFPSKESCVIFNSNGQFVRKISYPNPLKNEDSWINGYDICTVDGNHELWIASGFMEQRISRISLEDGKTMGEIKTEYPFSSFKVISKDVILLALSNNHYFFGISDSQGKINTVGLKKKDKDLFNTERFSSFDGNYFLQYPSATLIGYYDEPSGSIKEELLTEDNEYTNTWQKQMELIDKQGSRRGYRTALKSYYTIDRFIRNNGVELVRFTYKDKTFLSVRRDNGKFNTMEILPNKNNYLTNDLYPANNDFLQLSLSFDGWADSDDSILLYLLTDRSDPLELKAREIAVIEIF